MNEKTINNLIKECHEIAVSRGFYDCPECEGEGENWTHDKEVGFSEPCESCHGTGKDPNRNIGELLMLIVSELGEALEAHRKNKFATFNNYEKLLNRSPGLQNRLFEVNIKDTFEDKIANVFIRLFDLCGYLGIKPINNGWDGKLNNVGEKLFIIQSYLFNFHQERLFNKTTVDIDCFFAGMIWFCNRLNIDIEKHIKAKMEITACSSIG